MLMKLYEGSYSVSMQYNLLEHQHYLYNPWPVSNWNSHVVVHVIVCLIV